MLAAIEVCVWACRVGTWIEKEAVTGAVTGDAGGSKLGRGFPLRSHRIQLPLLGSRAGMNFSLHHHRSSPSSSTSRGGFQDHRKEEVWTRAGTGWPRPLRDDSGCCRHPWAVMSTCVFRINPEHEIAMGLEELDAHRVTHRRTTARSSMTKSAGYARVNTESTSIGAAFNSETCWDFSGYRGHGASSFGRCQQRYPYSIKRQRIELR